jgi:hypothetical protein
MSEHTSKNINHEIVVVGLKRAKFNVIDQDGKQTVLERTVTMKDTVWGLENALTHILRRATNCSCCGGLTPEMAVRNGDYEFFFTCYQVEKNKEIIKKTDYKKFAEFSQAKVWRTQNERERLRSLHCPTCP